MADHAGVAGPAGQVDGLQRFGQRADLVDLDQDRVGHPQLDAPLQAVAVGDEQVVAHQLHRGPQAIGQQLPAVPVILGNAVLDRHDRVAAHQLGQLFDHLGTAVAAAAKGVAAVFVKLGAGHIEGQRDLVAGAIAGLLDRLDQDVAGGVIAQVGGKATLIADGGAHALLMQQALEGVEHLGTHAQGFLEAAGTVGHHHEFLKVEAVGGVGAPVDDVHQRHRQQGGHRPPQVAVQRQAHAVGSGPGAGQADRQDRVGPQGALVVGAIQLDHGGVHGALVEGTQAAEGRGDLLFNVGDGLADAFAEVAAAAVAQLVGFVGAGAGAAGHDGPAAGAAFKQNLGFDGGGSPGVEHLAGYHSVDHKVEGIDHGLPNPKER